MAEIDCLFFLNLLSNSVTLLMGFYGWGILKYENTRISSVTAYIEFGKSWEAGKFISPGLQVTASIDSYYEHFGKKLRSW